MSTEPASVQPTSEESGPDKSKQFKVGGWGAHYVLIICSLLYLIDSIDRYVFSAVMQPMKVDLGLTDTQLGMAQTAFLLGMALFSFPIAYLVDRWSRKKSIAIMAVIWSATTAITGLAKNFIGVLIPRSFVGIGEAGFNAGGTALVSAVYKKEWRSRVLSIFFALGTIGNVLGIVLGGLMSVKYGWRSAFFVLGIPGIILAIFALFMRDYKTIHRTEASAETKGFGKSILAVIKIPSLRWFYIGFILLVFLSAAVGAWFPALAMRAMNINEAQAGTLIGYIFLAAIPGAVVGGFLADWWQKKSPNGRVYLGFVATFLNSVCVVVFAMLLFNGLGIAAGLLYGFTAPMANPIIASVSQDVVRPEHKGLAFGLAVFSGYIFGGAWSPLAVGAVSDALGGGADGLRVAIIGSSVIGVIGSLIILLAARHYAADREKVQHLTLAE